MMDDGWKKKEVLEGLPKQNSPSPLCCLLQDGWVGFRTVKLKKCLSAVDFYNGYLHQSVLQRQTAATDTVFQSVRATDTGNRKSHTTDSFLMNNTRVLWPFNNDWTYCLIESDASWSIHIVSFALSVLRQIADKHIWCAIGLRWHELWLNRYESMCWHLLPFFAEVLEMQNLLVNPLNCMEGWQVPAWAMPYPYQIFEGWCDRWTDVNEHWFERWVCLSVWAFPRGQTYTDTDTKKSSRWS